MMQMLRVGPVRVRRNVVPWIVLAASLLLTALATGLIASTARDREDARFRNSVQSTRDRVQARLDTYVALLRGGTGLFAASDSVSRDEFRGYVARLGIGRRYPGIQGIGYTVRIRPEAADSLVAVVRSRGFPDFTLRPDSARPVVHSILYLEPLDRRNRAALGYDMFTEPTRRAAMQRARDSGLPAMSGKVRLVQEIAGRVQAGFLLYLPFYGDRDPSTVATRRRALQGFVYAAFRADDFFDGIFGTERRPLVAFQVYDGLRAGPDQLLHDSRHIGVAPALVPEFTDTLLIQAAGRPWTLTFASTPAFEAGARNGLTLALALAGGLISLLLFAFSRVQLRAWTDAEQFTEQLQSQAVELEMKVKESQALNERLDVTNQELTTTNAELHTARAEAEQANQAKSEFLAAMSHELRTPLNAIGGYAELIELGIHGPVTTDQNTALGRIKRSQQHLLSLINDILNFARIEAGRVEYRAETVPVADIFTDLDAMTAPQLRSRGLSAAYEPCSPPDLAWRGDAEKIRQVLLNLLTNAIKFTPAGGQIEVRCAAAGDGLQVHVADTGCGIPSAKLDAIFDPFFQVDRQRVDTGQQGVGLGLAISRDLARGMGGDLTVQSTERQGSTFTLTLPRSEPANGRAQS